MRRSAHCPCLIVLVSLILSGCGGPQIAPVRVPAASTVPGSATPAPSGGTGTVLPVVSSDTTAYSGYFLYSTIDGHPAVFSLKDGKTIWTSDCVAGSPCWSIDGKSVIFVAANGNESDFRADLVYQSPFGEAERRMPLDPALFDPTATSADCSVSATGDYVAVNAASCVDGFCFVVDAETGKTVYLVKGYDMFWGPSGDTLCEEFCSEGLPISQEPGMWFELKLTEVPSGETRSIFKGAPDIDIFACGFADANTVIYEVHDTKIPDSSYAVRDTAGKAYATSPLKPAEIPAVVGTLTTCSGPSNGLWLLADQDPAQVIWLYDPETRTTIKAVAGRSPQWQPER